MQISCLFLTMSDARGLHGNRLTKVAMATVVGLSRLWDEVAEGAKNT